MVKISCQWRWRNAASRFVFANTDEGSMLLLDMARYIWQCSMEWRLIEWGMKNIAWQWSRQEDCGIPKNLVYWRFQSQIKILISLSVRKARLSKQLSTRYRACYTDRDSKLRSLTSTELHESNQGSDPYVRDPREEGGGCADVGRIWETESMLRDESHSFTYFHITA